MDWQAESHRERREEWQSVGKNDKMGRELGVREGGRGGKLDWRAGGGCWGLWYRTPHLTSLKTTQWLNKRNTRTRSQGQLHFWTLARCKSFFPIGKIEKIDQKGSKRFYLSKSNCIVVMSPLKEKILNTVLVINCWSNLLNCACFLHSFYLQKRNIFEFCTVEKTNTCQRWSGGLFQPFQKQWIPKNNYEINL